jgi:shikimate dehydrogenase
MTMKTERCLYTACEQFRMDVYGLIGNPVGHSLSPPMHEAGYEQCGIDARYVTFEPSEDGGEAAVRSAAQLGVSGLNVTIPFKQDVLDAVEPDALAARIGAVNTIDFGTDPPTGYNTDAVGVVRALEHHDVSITGRAVVVGAGGAGRAAAFGLADRGLTVNIANRTTEKATALATEVTESGAAGAATGQGLNGINDLLADADLLINATSVGMKEDRSPVPAGALHGDLAVLDAVYSPLDTRLLRDAQAAGATTVDGAWMLLYQGVAAFERWTDESAPVDAMNDALRGGLE